MAGPPWFVTFIGHRGWILDWQCRSFVKVSRRVEKPERVMTVAKANMSSASISIGAAARTLVRQCDRAVLSTTQADGTGWPYGSLVMTACDYDGRPILLLSDLAEHTKNLKQNARVSLLFDGTDGLDDRLTGARVTVMGRAAVTAKSTDRARYLARHPSSAVYENFADFNFYSVNVTKVHQVAGFGQIDWIPAAAFLCGSSSMAEFGMTEAETIEKLNKDHVGLGSRFGHVPGALSGEGWTFTGIDPEGCDLRLGGRVARITFKDPVTDFSSVKDALNELAGNKGTS